jgi:hypothetical protein
LAIEAVKVYDMQGYSSEKCADDWHAIADMNTDEAWRPANLSFVMIREDIWNHIVDNYVGEYYNYDEIDSINETNQTDRKLKYLNVKQYCRKEFEKRIANQEKLFAVLNNSNNNDDIDIRNKLKGLFYTSIFDYSNLDFVRNDVYNKIAMESVDLREDILKRFTEYTAIYDFIIETRRSWMIQSGCGSQHDGYDVHMMLAKKVLQLCEEKMKEYDDEEDV